MRGDDAISIGSQLRAARRAHGYTGQELHTALKEQHGATLSARSIYRIENLQSGLEDQARRSR